MRPTAFDFFAPNSILTKLQLAVTQGVALASLTAAAGCARASPPAATRSRRPKPGRSSESR